MRKEWVIGGALCLAFGAGGYFGLLGPQAHDTAALRDEAAALEMSNAATQAQLPALKSELASISGQVDALRELSAKVPPEINVPGLYEELAAAAMQAGLSGGVEDVSPTIPQLVTPAVAPVKESDAVADATTDEVAAAVVPSAPQGVIASFDVSMRVKGTIGQTVAFLHALKQAPRLSVVSSSSLSVDVDGMATMQITARYYLQQVDVDGLVAQIEALRNAAGSGMPTTGALTAVPTDPTSAPALGQDAATSVPVVSGG